MNSVAFTQNDLQALLHATRPIHINSSTVYLLAGTGTSAFWMTLPGAHADANFTLECKNQIRGRVVDPGLFEASKCTEQNAGAILSTKTLPTQFEISHFSQFVCTIDRNVSIICEASEVVRPNRSHSESKFSFVAYAPYSPTLSAMRGCAPVGR